MKILHLLSNPYFTGPAEPLFGLIRAQLRAGHAVKLGVDRQRDGNITRRAEAAGIPLEQHLLLSVKAGLRGQLADLATLRRLFRSSAYQVVHCHKSHEHSLCLLARPPGSSTRIVRTINKPSALRFGRRWLLRRSDGILTTAERDRARLVEQGAVDPSRVLTLRGFTDLDSYRPGAGGGELRLALGLTAATPVAGIVARIKKNRRHDLLLDAWRRVASRMPAARLLIAGRGEYADRLRHRIEATGLAQGVLMVGYTPDLPRFYDALDVMVLLAPGNDGTCRAGIEAMATGKPLVCPRGSSLEELVDHGRTGLLTAPDQAGALAEALIALLAERDKAAAMGAAARARVESAFTLEQHVAQVERIYRRASAGRDGAGPRPADGAQR